VTLYDYKNPPAAVKHLQQDPNGWPKYDPVRGFPFPPFPSPRSDRRRRGPVWGEPGHEDVGFPRRQGTYEECQAGRDPNIMNIADPCAGLPHGGIGFPQRPLPDFPGRPQPPIFDFPGMEGGYETLPYKPGAKMDPLMFLAGFAGEQLGRILGNR